MRKICVLFIIYVFLCTSPAVASDALIEAGRTATIDFLLENAITHNLISGGVVVIGNHDGILYSSARGKLNPTTDSPLININTLFDVASLTKVISTTPAVMKLLEEGRIGIMDPITRWFPEFEGTGREDITILNLLTHTSGLDDMGVSQKEPLNSAIQKAIKQISWREPGHRFHYADVNFILLGELVHRVTGTTLDVFCQKELFRPLGMNNTMFLPSRELAGSIAPTLNAYNMLVAGMVQDLNARRLGGVAGHAGLFSSAADMARYARMIMRGGALDGHRIFSERVISQMTSPYFYNKGAVVRGLGWDIESPYSAPKCSFFSQMSFGHTGYSGSSIWIDPNRDIFVVLLTTRLNYNDTRSFKQLRSDISTLGVALFWKYHK